MKYGCEYRIGSAFKIATFEAKNEDEARLKMMKFAELIEAHVQNIGKETVSKNDTRKQRKVNRI